MVIQPGDTATLDDPYIIFIFFRWTDLSTDAFETFFGHRNVANWHDTQSFSVTGKNEKTEHILKDHHRELLQSVL
jgi:hypothetical protein